MYTNVRIIYTSSTQKCLFNSSSHTNTETSGHNKSGKQGFVSAFTIRSVVISALFLRSSENAISSCHKNWFHPPWKQGWVWFVITVSVLAIQLLFVMCQMLPEKLHRCVACFLDIRLSRRSGKGQKAWNRRDNPLVPGMQLLKS